jgi:sugar lactone lactonase YvrE
MMLMSRAIMRVVLSGAALAMVAPSCLARYTTDWLANSYGSLAEHVGNAARSMWVAPDGTVYTASMWDESAGGIGIYRNGKTIGSIGRHSEVQGGAITGNATSLFAELQSDARGGSGAVGRFDRVTGVRDRVFQVSNASVGVHADRITGLATSKSLVYASDFPGSRVRVYTVDGIWQRDIVFQHPGALAADDAGNVWVARKGENEIVEFSVSGRPMRTLRMPDGSQPSALYWDATSNQLLVGDEGPDLNIKRYTLASGHPTLAGTFGVRGGYLDTSTGIKGQTGDKRFNRVAGIGRDAAGNLYVLNNPWGVGWDLARTGGTDIRAYDRTGRMQWELHSLNFEAIAAPDPGNDATDFYSGTNIYRGKSGGTFFANTVDPFEFPSDPRLDSAQRGEHFGQVARVGGNLILVAASQNPRTFHFFHFNAAHGYIAIPDGSLPGDLFKTELEVTGGFCLDSKGDVWAALDKTGAIYHYRLLGFDADGKPRWAAPDAIPVPASIRPLVRIVYLPESDTMILAQGSGSQRDWTQMSERIEVYHGWQAGNRYRPNPIVELENASAKSIAAAGDYLFVGYVHTVPNIDVFSLSGGHKVATLTNSSEGKIDVGNDVDSIYGLRAYLRTNGEYLVAKDNYNGSSVVVYRWWP